MRDNIIKMKSYAFALKIINLYRYLSTEKKEFIISKQILRSGTSVGPNVEEGICSQSKRDFIAKLSISLKEARETHYWLRLLKDGNFLSKKMTDSILSDCEELIAILTSILKSSRKM